MQNDLTTTFLWERGRPVCAAERVEWERVVGKSGHTPDRVEVNFAIAYGFDVDMQLDEHELGTAAAKIRIHIVRIDIRDESDIWILAYAD
jgi:hypothetical protein